MLLQLFTALANTREFIMRRQAILKAEKDINTHLSKNKTFLKFKYKLENEVLWEKLEEVLRPTLYSDVKYKTYHIKLYRNREDSLISVNDSLLCLTKDNTTFREEAALYGLQDRNIFFRRMQCVPIVTRK